MTTIESSLLVEELAMDDTTTISTKPVTELVNSPSKNNKKKLLAGESNNGKIGGGDDDDDTEEEVWDMLSKSFRQVQAVFDQNKNLFQQVNEHHQSKIPDNLVKNVSLIREINGNISKVISIYSHISVNFSNMVQQRRRIKKGNSVETD